jgi:hypothetical protein
MSVGDLVRFKPGCEVQGLAILLQSLGEWGAYKTAIVRVRPVEDPFKTIVAGVSNLELVSESR